MNAEMEWLRDQIKRIDDTIALMEKISDALLPGALDGMRRERETVKRILAFIEAPRIRQAANARDEGSPTY